MNNPGTWLDRFFTAQSVVTANFTQPAAGANVVVTLQETGWMLVGNSYFVQNGGAYQVTAIASDGVTVTLMNTSAGGNAAPGATIPAGSKIGISGPPGAPGTLPGETDTVFANLLSDGPVTVYTLATPLAAYESAIMTVTVLFQQIGVDAVGGTISRWADVQNIGGTITDTLSGAASPAAFDYDNSSPTPSLPTVLQPATAQILQVSGPALAVVVQRPPGVACRVRAVVSVSRQPRPAGVALSIAPALSTISGGVAFQIPGDGLANPSQILFGTTPATGISGTDHLAQGTTPALASGTYDVTVVTPQGTYVLPAAYVATPGVIPLAPTSLSQDTFPGEGGTYTLVLTGPTGAGWTGALGVSLKGNAVGSFTVNSDTQITISAIPANMHGAGVGDVIITSRTSNTNAAGNNLVAYKPNGLVGWLRSDLHTTLAGSLGAQNITAWTDMLGGANPWHLVVQGGSIPYRPGDIGNLATVGMLVSTSNFRLNSNTKFTGGSGGTGTMVVMGKRPQAVANSYLFSLFDNTLTTTDTTQAGSIVVTDVSTSALTLSRNSVAQTAAPSPDTTHPFILSARFSGSLGILRLNGTDGPSISVSGAFAGNECIVGNGFVAGSGRYGGTSDGEIRIAEFELYSSNLSTTDLAALSAIATWKTGQSLTA